MSGISIRPAKASSDADLLDRFASSMRSLKGQSGLGSWSYGMAQWDAELSQHGRAFLKAKAPRSSSNDGTPRDVYFATKIYAAGGHSALIGDFVRTLDSEGSSSDLVLTGADEKSTHEIPENARCRTGIPRERIHVLSGASLQERMAQLIDRLDAWRPKRLFLFHHPDDVVAVAAAQPELAAQTLLVHHADASPTLGLHLPHVRLIDLHPTGASRSRVLGLDPSLLPLTSPDPGPRAGGFLQHGKLVTVTCGAASKYDRAHFFSYAETVGVILRSTGGRHVHVGPLPESLLSEIHETLHREGLRADQWVHVPHTASLPATLWEHGCDLYVASFPVDGARVKAEVAASSVPYLGYSARLPQRAEENGEEWRGSLWWSTWEDLSAVLKRASDASFLAEKSRLSRESYECRHHPQKFAAHLENILRGGRGAHDSDEAARDTRTLHSLVRAIMTNFRERLSEGELEGLWRALFDHMKLEENRLLDVSHLISTAQKELREKVRSQEQRIDFLQEQRKRLEDKVNSLHEEQKRMLEGKSWRGRLLRWLHHS